MAEQQDSTNMTKVERNLQRCEEYGDTRFIVAHKSNPLMFTKHGVWVEIIPIDGAASFDRKNVSLTKDPVPDLEGDPAFDVVSVNVKQVDGEGNELISTCQTGVALNYTHNVDHFFKKTDEYLNLDRMKTMKCTKAKIYSLHDMTKEEISSFFHAKEINGEVYVYDNGLKLSEYEQKEYNDYITSTEDDPTVPLFMEDVNRYISWNDYVSDLRKWVNDVVSQLDYYTSNDSAMYCVFYKIEFSEESLEIPSSEGCESEDGSGYKTFTESLPF